MSPILHRRKFITTLLGAGAASLAAAEDKLSYKGENIQFGLVTYMWGADLDLPALISALEKAKILGVELRVDHAHGVSPKLTPKERAEVRKRFGDSPVDCVGMGTNFEFHSPKPEELRKNIEGAMEHIKLSHDIGASGVKVKPNALPKEVEKEKTLEQIARALQQLGDHALGFGQEIRLEVHGGVTDLGDIATIMKTAARDNVRVCWNSNQKDIEGEGIEANFAKVRDYLGHTLHIRGATVEGYPWDKLAKLLVDADWEGWVLLEAGGKRPDGDPAAVLGAQRDAFMQLVTTARKAAA
ncbi:MAG: sugar phosphate isomerase/epimerase [Verrucomicrobiaceae bacterium]|nr:sugar phosphate isomerase/epimerase [Verrucomicrobiaceae bacterium]